MIPTRGTHHNVSIKSEKFYKFPTTFRCNIHVESETGYVVIECITTWETLLKLKNQFLYRSPLLSRGIFLFLGRRGKIRLEFFLFLFTIDADDNEDANDGGKS